MQFKDGSISISENKIEIVDNGKKKQMLLFSQVFFTITFVAVNYKKYQEDGSIAYLVFASILVVLFFLVIYLLIIRTNQPTIEINDIKKITLNKNIFGHAKVAFQLNSGKYRVVEFGKDESITQDLIKELTPLNIPFLNKL